VSIQPSIGRLVESFGPLMGRRTFAKFSVLLLVWSLAPQRRTVTELIKTLRSLERRQRRLEHGHHSSYHRFFSRDIWKMNRLGARLGELLKPWLPAEGPITTVIDDCLFRRPGAAVLGNGFHHDPLATVSSGHHTQRVLAAGLDFVVFALVVPIPFMHAKAMAIPIAWELYRTPGTCPKDDHHTRPQLAVRLLKHVRTLWSDGRKVRVSVDDGYSCKEVLRNLPENVEIVGRLPPSARLTDPTVIQGKLGRPRVWGVDLPKPTEVAADDKRPWVTEEVKLYGKTMKVATKSQNVVWKSGRPDQTLKMVITHDVQDRYAKDWFLFISAPTASAVEVVEAMGRRWTLETCFRDVKQTLGAETTCNGHKHTRKRGEAGGARKSGFVADPKETPVASARTVPFAMLVYGLIVLWYLMWVEVNPFQPLEDVQRARRQAPWYRHKIKVSFADMHRTFNLAIHDQLDQLLPPQPLQLQPE